MRITRWIGSVTVLGLLAGCSADTAPTAPRPFEIPDEATESRSFNFLQLTVLGAGQVDLTSAGAQFGLADFYVIAFKSWSGHAWGFFRQRRSSPAGTVDFEGIVTCLTNDPAFPGRARVGGRVTKNNSTSASFQTENHEVGDDVWFRVQDGSGAEDGIDRSTTYGFKPTLVNTSAEYCALPFDGLPWWSPASTFPLANGHILVRAAD